MLRAAASAAHVTAPGRRGGVSRLACPQELPPAERTHYADAWAEMEAVLGRPAFHRVFDYMREVRGIALGRGMQAALRREPTSQDVAQYRIRGVWARRILRVRVVAWRADPHGHRWLGL